MGAPKSIRLPLLSLRRLTSVISTDSHLSFRPTHICHFDRREKSQQGEISKKRYLMPEMNLAVDPGWNGLGGR
jgi:hypothetical protein